MKIHLELEVEVETEEQGRWYAGLIADVVRRQCKVIDARVQDTMEEVSPS